MFCQFNLYTVINLFVELLDQIRIRILETVLSKFDKNTDPLKALGDF